MIGIPVRISMVQRGIQRRMQRLDGFKSLTFERQRASCCHQSSIGFSPEAYLGKNWIWISGQASSAVLTSHTEHEVPIQAIALDLRKAMQLIKMGVAKQTNQRVYLR
jgi:hypothetical protein